MKLMKFKINVSLNTTIDQKMNEFWNNAIFRKNIGLMYVPISDVE